MVIRMSSSAGVILETFQEALEMIMLSECKEAPPPPLRTLMLTWRRPQKQKQTSWSPAQTHLKMSEEGRWMKQWQKMVKYFGLQQTLRCSAMSQQPAV